MCGGGGVFVRSTLVLPYLVYLWSSRMGGHGRFKQVWYLSRWVPNQSTKASVSENHPARLKWSGGINSTCGGCWSHNGASSHRRYTHTPGRVLTLWRLLHMLRHFDPPFSGLWKICIVSTPIFEQKWGKCRISTPIFGQNLAKCIVSTPLFFPL